MNEPLVLKNILQLLDDNQATDIVSIDVHEQTTITDYMVICSGRSSRHVKAIADKTAAQMKAKGYPVISEAGLQSAEWVLLDFGDVILHVMQPSVRAFYHLEGLWHPKAS